MSELRNKSTGRDYVYDTKYESTEEQKHKRALRNKARRKAIREGLVRKGDRNDVHHPNGFKGSVKIIHRSKNRSIK